jgi:hypothetical protein
MDATHAPAAPSSLSSRLARVALGLALCVVAARHAAAQTSPPSPDRHEPPLSRVEVAGFAGLQFGGGVQAAPTGRKASFGAGLDYGGTVDVRFAESWSVEALYSRQGTELPGLDATIERFMVGVTEEHDHGRTKVFGVALLGATRFVPGATQYGSQVLFTLGLGLGVKYFVSDRVALRAEARGFYAITQSGGGLFCAGGCLFVFSSSGLAQGDVTAGVAVAF